MDEKTNEDDGGNGESREKAIVVKCDDGLMGMLSLNGYINEMHGRRGVDWFPESSIQCGGNGREYSLRIIKLKDGTEKKYWFDITSYFPKQSGSAPIRTPQELEELKRRITKILKERENERG